MNLIENITYGLMKLPGLSKEEAERRAMELLKTVSLPDKTYDSMDEISKKLLEHRSAVMHREYVGKENIIHVIVR